MQICVGSLRYTVGGTVEEEDATVRMVVFLREPVDPQMVENRMEI